MMSAGFGYSLNILYKPIQAEPIAAAAVSLLAALFT